MPRYLWIVAVGLVSIGLWGCGGDDAKKDEKKDAANNAPPMGGPPGGPGGMPGMGGMQPPGGMGMPGMGGDAAPAAEKPAAEAAGTGSSQALLQFIPESIKLCAGANIAALSDKDTPFGQQVLAQFRPLLTMLDKAGVKESQIEQLWSGTDTQNGDMAICVRTKADYSSSTMTKKLGAAEKAEKIGKATIHRITKSGCPENAVAYIDSKTFMVGRFETVAAGLKNPKSGAIQLGIKAMKAPNAYFWISGGDQAAMRQLNLRNRESSTWMSADAATPQAMAIGMAKNSGEGAVIGGGGGGPGMGGPGMGGPGMGGPGMGGPGMGGPGMGGPGMGGPGMGGGGGGGSKRPLKVVVGWAFTSEVAAKVMEQIFDSIMESMKPKQPAGGMAGGMSPPGGPGGGMTPPGGPGGGMSPPGGPGGAGPGMGGPGGGGGNGRRGRRRIDNALPLDTFEGIQFQQNQGPGAGHGPGPGGGPGMGGMGGQQPSEDDPNVTFYDAKRDGEYLRLSYSVPKDDSATVSKIIGKAFAAIAPPPLDDGLFQGSLPLLAEGFHKWEAASAPDKFTGYRKTDGEIYEEHYSWLTELLPYIGYDGLYRKFDFQKTWRGPLNGPYAETVIPSFLNPADSRTMWNERGIPPLGVTHFAGMAGVEDRRNVVAAQLPRTDPRAGIFGYDRIAKTNEITDGTSSTILMIGTGELAAPWIMGGGATIRGARQPYFDSLTGFGSRGLKTPGAYVLMADGSARVVAGTIDPEIFKAMCTIHGAEQIDMAKLVGQSGN